MLLLLIQWDYSRLKQLQFGNLAATARSYYQYNSSRPENFSSKVRRVTTTPALALSPVRLFEIKNY